MIKILESEYGLEMDSKISEIYDTFDLISFLLSCEEYYNLEIFDDEAMFIEYKDLSFIDIEDLFIFLRDGYATESIDRLISENIEELSAIRPDYRWHLIERRNSKIDSLLN